MFRLQTDRAHCILSSPTFDTLILLHVLATVPNDKVRLGLQYGMIEMYATFGNVCPLLAEHRQVTASYALLLSLLGKGAIQT